MLHRKRAYKPDFSYPIRRICRNMSMQICRALETFLLQKKLSPRKIRNLLSLGNLINRLAGVWYIAPEEVEKLEKKFGVKPDIITWADQLQNIVASDYWEKDEKEFEHVTETIMHDIISAALLFKDKPGEFRERVRDEGNLALGNERSGAEKELALFQWNLLGYFEEMHLQPQNLSDKDMTFFAQYSQRKIAS